MPAVVGSSRIAADLIVDPLITTVEVMWNRTDWGMSLHTASPFRMKAWARDPPNKGEAPWGPHKYGVTSKPATCDREPTGEVICGLPRGSIRAMYRRGHGCFHARGANPAS